MGGSGSGTWYRWNKKATTESQHRVDIRYLKQLDSLKPGTTGRLFWTNRGEETGSINYRVTDTEIFLNYRSRQNSGDWEDVKEHVSFDRTPCNYGGFRLWLLCPRCSKRVALLYGAGKRFLCRHCYGLTYASQQEAGRDRLVRRAEKIRKRLGGSDCIFDPFPQKPKRMHWQTYWRLKAEALEIEESVWGSIDRSFGIHHKG